MPMKTLDKQAQQRLMAAVDDVVDAVDGGVSPNDAIVKVAQDQQFPPGHVRLLAVAYNIGRTTRQRETGSDPFEKGAEFALADAGQILETLYPTHVKTASQQFNTTAVSADYDMPPSWFNRHDNDWTAEVRVGLMSVPHHPNRPKQAQALCDQLRLNLRESRREVSAAGDRLRVKLAKLEDYFLQVGSRAIGEVAENAAALHGAAGRAVMNHVQARVTKQASAVKDPWHEVDAAREPYRTLAAAVAVARELTEKVATHKADCELAGLAAEELFEAVTPSRPQSAALAGLIPAEKQAAGAVMSGIGLTLGADAARAVGGQLKAPDRESLVAKHLAKLADPKHEQQLRDIATRSLLQNLLMDEPVTRGQDVHDMAGAYNDLSQLAPRLAANPLAARSTVRKQLAGGGLDPFDVSQILKMERDLAETAGPSGEMSSGPHSFA